MIPGLLGLSKRRVLWSVQERPKWSLLKLKIEMWNKLAHAFISFSLLPRQYRLKYHFNSKKLFLPAIWNFGHFYITRSIAEYLSVWCVAGNACILYFYPTSWLIILGGRRFRKWWREKWLTSSMHFWARFIGMSYHSWSAWVCYRAV